MDLYQELILPSVNVCFLMPWVFLFTMISVNAFWQANEKAGQWHCVERKRSGVEKSRDSKSETQIRTGKDVALMPRVPMLFPWQTLLIDHSTPLFSHNLENALSSSLQHYRLPVPPDRIWHGDVETAKSLSVHFVIFEWWDLKFPYHSTFIISHL